MNFIINAYAQASGFWKKVAALLPLLAGIGSTLVGAGNIALQMAHATNAAEMLHILKTLNASDPNVMLIMGGLTALGVHTNHSQINATLADHTAQLSAPATPDKK